MTEAIVIEIDEAKDPSRLDDSGKMRNQLETGGTIVLEDEAHPDEVEEAEILERFPHAIFFGGQLAFRKNFFFSRLLHNYTVFVLQKHFYDEGIPFFILPIRI